MDERLARADSLLKAGKVGESCDLLMEIVNDTPDQSANVYRVLVVQLYNLKRYEDGVAMAQLGVARHPRHLVLWNTLGVLLRRLQRYEEALKALDQAQKLDPKSLAPLTNKANIYNDMGNGAAAEAAFVKLSRADPRNPEYHRGLARALLAQKKYDAAFARCRQAIGLKKDYVDAWLDWSGGEASRGDLTAALEVNEKAMAAAPGQPRLLESKAVLLRRMGQLKAAEAFLTELMPTHGDEAWLPYALGGVIGDQDRARANAYLIRATELEPDNTEYRTALMESYERSRHGDEGANIEAGYQLLEKTLAEGNMPNTPKHNKVYNELLIRVCDYDKMPLIGSFEALGRGWAETGRHTALLKHLARVSNDEERLELLAQHKLWGEKAMEQAAREPIRRPAPGPRAGKIRLGFMSSDLRGHPVGYFAYPLFEFIDRERFEVFVYSFYHGVEDSVQKYITSQVTAYRWNSEISAQDAAQMIADDDLDMLIELGGSTHMNKLEVMAYRPAPIQASWLGYPHSAGLETIDYLIVDPHNVPPRPELLVEKPLMMPESWIALGSRFFSNTVEIKPAPELANGYITYGTANNPHKYTRNVLRTWAKVLAATPDSKFAFIRPEGSSPSFRKNILKEFAAEGIGADRVIFHVIRGTHLPFYNELDISLDPFPLTGGTTTAESLWMGVPLISLVGPAFFERLSASIMANTGIGDLAVDNLDDYVKTAVKLAGDRERRTELRVSLRDRMRNSALGQTDQFAKDFYDLIHRTVRPEGQATVSDLR
jgi:predicted O-linked N-acetylglucosamine transferase (SPINDLY family)